MICIMVTAARTTYEFVADDGDGDEDCLPVSVTEFNIADMPYMYQR